MTDQADKKRIEALELENVALRKRVMILEGAHKVLTKRILAVFEKPRIEPSVTA